MSWAGVGGAVLSQVAGGLIGGAFGSDKKSNPQYLQNTQTSKLTPSPEAKPIYDWLAKQGMDVLNTPVPYYPFQTFVSPSAPTQLAHQMGIGGVGQMEPYLQQGMQNYGFLSNAADVANNPYVNQMMAANQGLTLDTLFNKVLPNIQSSHNAVSSAGRNNPRLGMLQGQAIGDAMTGLARTNAQTQLGAYNTGVGAQTSAAQMLQQMLGAQLMPYTGLSNVGKDIEGYQQGALTDQMERFMWPYTEPYQRMQAASGLLGTFAPYGTQTGTGQTPNPNYLNPYQAALGGAQMGMGLYNQFRTPTATPQQMQIFTGGYNQSAPVLQNLQWGGGMFNNAAENFFGPGGGMWGP